MNERPIDPIKVTQWRRYRKFPRFISPRTRPRCLPAHSFRPLDPVAFLHKEAGSIVLSLSFFFSHSVKERDTQSLLFFSFLQVLSALDILQPPHLDFFQEMYPFLNTRTRGHVEDKSRYEDSVQVNSLVGDEGIFYDFREFFRNF